MRQQEKLMSSQTHYYSQSNSRRIPRKFSGAIENNLEDFITTPFETFGLDPLVVKSSKEIAVN